MSLESQSDKSMDKENEFLIIKWSLNKIYTIIENFKCVKLYALVTCYVNYKKDIGEVIFVGKEEECKKRLTLMNRNFKDSSSNISFKAEIIPKPSLINRILSTSSKSLASNKFISKKKLHSSCNHLDVENQYFQLNSSLIRDAEQTETTQFEEDNDENYDGKCNNCKLLNKKINELNRKLINYENLFIKFKDLLDLYEKVSKIKETKQLYVPKIIVEDC